MVQVIDGVGSIVLRSGVEGFVWSRQNLVNMHLRLRTSDSEKVVIEIVF